MIEVHLENRHAVGRRGSDGPKLVAIFSFRYDAHLVPDLIENLRPLVDGWISFDDRGATELFSGEAERRRRLLETAREVGADWVLAVDPDERFETGLAHSLPEFLAVGEPTIWTFRLRELYTPSAYRIDGVWGSKRQGRLFPILDWETYGERPLHGQWAPEDPIYRVRDTGFNLYHLKMIAPARRRARRDLYAVLDPARSMQAIGYDYLVDEDGAVFEDIPPGRGYLPVHREDGGLWMGETPADNSRDAPEDLIALADRLSRHGQVDRALEVVRRAAEAHPDSGAVRRSLAEYAVRVGAFEEAARAARKACALSPDDAAAAQITRTVKFLRESAWADERGPDPSIEWPWSQARRDFLQVAAGGEARIATPFLDETVRIRRGRNVPAARLAVVVIGLGAPRSLTAAVDSLLAQSVPCEIVVVNTGGGAVGALLGARLDAVTRLETDKAAFVGAARNLGVLASRAEVVGFLAGDCRAGRDWVRHRLDAHDDGATAVASAVAHDASENGVAHAHHHLLFARRVPTTPAARALRYSASYRRALFEERGLFDPGLRIGEDSRFNAGLARNGIEIVWRPDVVTVHTAVTGAGAAVADLFKRGIRAGRVAPLIPIADLQRTAAHRLGRPLLSAARRDSRDRANGARVSLTLEAATPRPRDALLSCLAAAYEFGRLVSTVRLLRSSRLMATAHEAREADQLERAQRLARRAWRSHRDPAYVRLACDILAEQGRRDEALTLLSRAAAEPGATAALLDAYVLALEAADDPAAALTPARKSLAFHPTPQRFAKVARLSARLDDPAGVVQACRGAAAMAPGASETMRRLSRLLYRAGATDEALRLARLAAQTHPDDPQSGNWLRKLTREVCAAHIGD